MAGYYTTTRNIRELQLFSLAFGSLADYTTTRNIRELQPGRGVYDLTQDYTTTRNIRELQHQSDRSNIGPYYTTTRNIRELQPHPSTCISIADYTTTRNIRELQLTICYYLDRSNYTTTRNIRELQLARRGCPGRSHYSPPLSAISIPTAPPRWLPSIPWAGAKSANCTANYKISRRAFPPAGARFFILLLKLQKTKRGLKSTTFRQFQSSLAQKEGFELLDQKLFLFYCAVSCPIPL